MTIEELLKGKETIIKGKEYLATEKYVQPFLDRVKSITKEYRVMVKMPDQITDGAITYNRVLVQAITDTEHADYNMAICLSYALDVRKPVAKIYKCYINKKTGDIMAFNPMWQTVQEIKPEEPLEFAGVKQVYEATDDFETQYEKLRKSDVFLKDTTELFGKWMRNALISESNSDFGKVKIAASNVIDAYKLLALDTDSAFKIDTSAASTRVDVYEAFATTITSDTKDFINKFEKTLLLNIIL